MSKTTKNWLSTFDTQTLHQSPILKKWFTYLKEESIEHYAVLQTFDHDLALLTKDKHLKKETLQSTKKLYQIQRRYYFKHCFILELEQSLTHVPEALPTSKTVFFCPSTLNTSQYRVLAKEVQELTEQIALFIPFLLPKHQHFAKLAIQSQLLSCRHHYVAQLEQEIQTLSSHPLFAYMTISSPQEALAQLPVVNQYYQEESTIIQRVLDAPLEQRFHALYCAANACAEDSSWLDIIRSQPWSGVQTFLNQIEALDFSNTSKSLPSRDHFFASEHFDLSDVPLFLQTRVKEECIRVYNQMEKKPYENIGAWIKTMRLERNWNYRELHMRSGVSTTHLFRLEAGERGKPSLMVMTKLAKAFGIPMSELSHTLGVPEYNIGEAESAPASPLLAKLLSLVEDESFDPEVKQNQTLLVQLIQTIREEKKTKSTVLA